MTFLTFIVGMIAGVILVKVNRHEKEMRSKCLILPSMGIKGKICSTYRITLDEKHDACLFTCMTDVKIPDSVGIFLPSDFHVMVECETEADKNFVKAIGKSVIESNGQGARLFVGGTFIVKEGNIIFCYVLFLILGVVVIGIYSMSAATYRFMSRTAHRLFPSLMKRLEKTYMTEEYKPGGYARLAPCRRPPKPVQSVLETQKKKQGDETNV